MGKIPSKPVVTNQPWINGVTKLNQVNLTRGINQNISNIKTAVDGVIDALGGPGADPENLEEITYAALKTLRDGGNLDPGKLYRITDYMTTTTKADTRSAGHQFDVIVRALAADKLSEEAYAALHTGDTYFANSKLGAWKLWYSIDNDTSRFDWADTTNGKGVIYRMIDEFGNDLPYDFKNIQFKRYKGAVVTEEVGAYVTRYPKFINMHDYYANLEEELYANRAQKAYEMLHEMTEHRLNGAALPFLYASGALGYSKVSDLSEELADFLTDASHGALSNDDYVVAICYEGDHEGYLCVLVVDNSTPFYFYTFSNGTPSSDTGVLTSIVDQSLSGSVYLNVFEAPGKRYSLDTNVFIGVYFHDNTVGNEFYNNTIGDGFYKNIVGNSFYNNTLGTDFNLNTVGSYFVNNTTGTYFARSTVSSDFSENTIGKYFGPNIIEGSFVRNTIGGDFQNNSVKDGFHDNIVGNRFTFNTVGIDFDHNIVGSLSDRAFIRYCRFDDGVQNIFLNSPDAYNSNNYIQNVHIHLGVKGASYSNRLVISVPRDLPYETEYYLDDLGNLTVSNFSTQITWSDLKDLRDAGRLVPGKQYRIIDYLTAVEQPECRSAGHPFDIIVTALTANTLSEEAKAVTRDGDNYFIKSIPVSASWKPGVTLSDIETLYKMTDDEDSPYNTPVEKERIFTQMGTMVNPATGVEVPYLFEPSPEDGGEPSVDDRKYLFVGEYEFNGVVYDQWEECYVDGTSVSPDRGRAYYELTNVVVDYGQGVLEKIKLSAWKLKYCLDNDYDRFGFAVRHDVIRVKYTNPPTYLYLRYPSLDGDDGLAWVFVNNTDNLEIEDPNVDYDDLDTSDVVYTPTLSINVGDVFLDGGDPVTVLATRIGKGVIYEMEDEWGNKLPYDFKNVQFKRYKVTHDTSAYDGFDDQYVGCKNIHGSIASPKHYTVEDDSDFKWCYTFNWYNEVGDSEDYSIIGNTRLHNDEDVISGCYNNVFGNCLESDLHPAVETYQNRMYLGNNVLWDAYEKNDGISPGFRSNTIGNSFYYSTMGNSFSINIMGNNFNNNTVGDEFSFNVGGNGFSYSTVGNNFNTNTVGNNFSTNTVGDVFSGNTIGNSFNSNTVGSNFYSNTVGNKFQSNIVGNYIYSSSIKDGISYITLDAPSGSVGNKLQYITIGSSVYGSYYNRLAITPIRNVNYEQEYVNEDKVVNQVSVS